MELCKVVFLGFIQGLTEFLPVSSSGHLVIFESLFGFSAENLALTVALHAGTLISVMIFYRAELLLMFQDLIRGTTWGDWRRQLREREGLRMFYLVCVASVPTGIIGIVFHDALSESFSNPRYVGLELMITGAILWFSNSSPAWLQKKSPTGSSERFGVLETTTWMAFVIGVVQGISIIPGISRSGATIVAALLLGFQPAWAARYSFLLSLPAVAGACLVELPHITGSHISWVSYFLGFVVAFVFGLLSLKWVVTTVEKGRFRAFSYYVFPLGLVSFIYFSWFF